VINRGGEKVHPREIEEVLLSDPHIRGAAVVGRPHRLLGEECVAYVVTDPGYTGSSPDRIAGQLLDRCRQALSPNQQPASIIVVDALPAGPTGKPDRRALRAAAGGLTSAAAPSAAAPRPESRTSIPRPLPVNERSAPMKEESTMNVNPLSMPLRSVKPRQEGLTVVIDNGIPRRRLRGTRSPAPPTASTSSSLAGARRSSPLAWKRR